MFFLEWFHFLLFDLQWSQKILLLAGLKKMRYKDLQSLLQIFTIKFRFYDIVYLKSYLKLI